MRLKIDTLSRSPSTVNAVPKSAALKVPANPAGGLKPISPCPCWKAGP
jgi:hypothetical protein